MLFSIFLSAAFAFSSSKAIALSVTGYSFDDNIVSCELAFVAKSHENKAISGMYLG
ncbi:hypothetical protein HRG84_03065 [Flavisolibacter sp. BT320]|nr:hypothetical protein [Flavisolibacter longurius]